MHDLTVYIYFYNIVVFIELSIENCNFYFIRNMIINAGFM